MNGLGPKRPDTINGSIAKFVSYVFATIFLFSRQKAIFVVYLLLCEYLNYVLVQLYYKNDSYFEED